MVNAKEFFSGNYLKAEDCKGGEIVEITDDSTIEEIQSPEGKVKAVLNVPISMEGKDKIFTPNKSNGNVMVEAFGEDTAKWKGQKFQIELAKVNVFGKIKDSIVVKPLVPEKK